MVLPCEIHGIAILDLRQALRYSCAESVISPCGITGLDLSETDLWYCCVVSVVSLYGVYGTAVLFLYSPRHSMHLGPLAP